MKSMMIILCRVSDSYGGVGDDVDDDDDDNDIIIIIIIIIDLWVYFLQCWKHPAD